MSSPTGAPHVVEDCGGFVQLLSDGNIIRTPLPIPQIYSTHRDDGSVLWNDVEYNTTHKLHLRLYKPLHRLPSDKPKLPIMFYIHGGGFCIGSRTLPNFHYGCLRLASDLRVVVVAIDYRLAPEHRLPAAIEDSLSAVDWIKAQATAHDPDPFLAEVADFENVFVSGDSAGANLVHQLALRFGMGELGAVRIRGYILLYPFFAGTHRTKSEVECPKDAVLHLEFSDQLWRLSLPQGATLDHPFANPFSEDGPNLESVELGPMLVVVGGCDFLRDRVVEYAKRLEKWGKLVELVEFAGEQHGFFSIDPWSEASSELVGGIKRFVDKNLK